MLARRSSEPSGSTWTSTFASGSENDFAAAAPPASTSAPAASGRDDARRPQNRTCGASRAAGSSISKYSRGSKLKIPATMFVGTVSSALSYVRTASL